MTHPLASMTKKEERQLAKMFKEGYSVGILMAFWKLTEAQVDRILRKFIRPGGRK